jgi:hypothetical protein
LHGGWMIFIGYFTGFKVYFFKSQSTQVIDYAENIR